MAARVMAVSCLSVNSLSPRCVTAAQRLWPSDRRRHRTDTFRTHTHTHTHTHIHTSQPTMLYRHPCMKGLGSHVSGLEARVCACVCVCVCVCVCACRVPVPCGSNPTPSVPAPSLQSLPPTHPPSPTHTDAAATRASGAAPPAHCACGVHNRE